jgi:hypothetical protein
LATFVLPLLEVNETALSSSSVFAGAILAISSRLMIVTGNAVSASMRLIDDPVTSIFSPRATSWAPALQDDAAKSTAARL